MHTFIAQILQTNNYYNTNSDKKILKIVKKCKIHKLLSTSTKAVVIGHEKAAGTCIQLTLKYNYITLHYATKLSTVDCLLLTKNKPTNKRPNMNE